MREKDIRIALRRDLTARHASETGTLILDEVDVCCGAARVDVAVVNGFMSGYEIKSESDTLERLPSQREIYNRVFDFVSIVTADHYTDAALAMIPTWWGLYIVSGPKEVAEVRGIREPIANRDLDPACVAQLLWREEALQELEVRQAADGIRTKPRRFLWQRMTEIMSLDEIRSVARKRLKSRQDWRSASQRKSNDEMFLPGATS